MLYFLISSILLAQDPRTSSKMPIDESIIVEAHRDFEVYVAPIQIFNEAERIEAVIDEYSVFSYASMHSHNAKIDNGYGGHESLTLNYDDFKVFNEDTIKYSWENCNYSKDPKRCAYQNNHFLLETRITIDENQLVVNMILYDPELQVISQGNVVSNKIINWIKQQEINSSYQNTTPVGQTQPSSNCSGSSCRPQTPQGSSLSQTIVSINKPKEELPLMLNKNRPLLSLFFYSNRVIIY